MKGKVAFIITTLGGGGAEKVLALLANYIAAEGYDVLVVCLEQEPHAYTLDKRVRTHVLKSGTLNFGYLKGLSIPLQALELSHLLRHEKPSATLSFLVRPNLVHILTKWLGNRDRIVVSEHLATKLWYEAMGFTGSVMLGLMRWLYSKADKIIAVSDGVWQGLDELGVRPGSVEIIHNPISMAEMSGYIAAAGVTGRAAAPPFRVVNVGRLCDQKDQVTLLQAFALLIREIDAHLWLVGEGPARAQLKALTASLGLSERVQLMGWLPDPFPVLAKADLFVLSSRFEGFGNVLVEALACGVPCVSTDCPSGPSEILCGGEFGRLVPTQDPQALAQAMAATLKLSKPEREAQIDRGLNRAHDFDISVVGRTYLKALSLEDFDS